MNRVKLGDILQIKHGYAFKSENYVEKSPYALVTLANISGSNNFQFTPDKTTYYGAAFPDEFKLYEDDLIMPLTEQVVGLFGNSAFVPKINGIQFVLNQRVGKVIPIEEKADKYYLHYLLSTDIVRDQLEYRASGTRQRNISPNDVYDVTVFIPDINIQRKIGKTLYDLERKINLNNQINDNLQHQIKLLYDYWFTQFDFPDENGKPYRASGGAMVWNEELKREIPAGWDVYNLGEHCDILLGGTPDTSKNEYWNGTINWLNSGEVSQFPVVSSELRITQAGLDNSATKLMPANTVVVSITGNIRASILAIDTCANQSVVGILESDDLKSQYIYPYMCNLLTHYTSISTGNCQQHINKGTIEDSLILLPNKDTLKKYYLKTEFLYNQITNNALEIQKLTALRDWLLPMLMNSQATISD